MSFNLTKAIACWQERRETGHKIFLGIPEARSRSHNFHRLQS
ncbi:MAG TPA: hypothetical protein V6D16_01680 [Candidatus Obscuribacterales bacterium]